MEARQQGRNDEVQPMLEIFTHTYSPLRLVDPIWMSRSFRAPSEGRVLWENHRKDAIPSRRDGPSQRNGQVRSHSQRVHGSESVMRMDDRQQGVWTAQLCREMSQLSRKLRLRVQTYWLSSHPD